MYDGLSFPHVCVSTPPGLCKPCRVLFPGPARCLLSGYSPDVKVPSKVSPESPPCENSFVDARSVVLPYMDYLHQRFLVFDHSLLSHVIRPPLISVIICPGCSVAWNFFFLSDA